MKVKLTLPTSRIPERAHKTDAGADLFSPRDVTLPPNSHYELNLGVQIELPPNTVGLILAKSGLGTQHGIRPRQCIGTIDEPYRGDIKVVLENSSGNTVHIKQGQKVCQLVIMPVFYMEFEVVDELSTTERGVGGFGSTGAF